MASRALVLDERHAVTEQLLAIPEVEAAYAEVTRNSLSVLVVVPDKNENVQQRIIDVEAEMIDSFPSLRIDFDVVFRCNRELRELVVPRGTRLFAR
jgi:hypothetical protein